MVAFMKISAGGVARAAGALYNRFPYILQLVSAELLWKSFWAEGVLIQECAIHIIRQARLRRAGGYRSVTSNVAWKRSFSRTGTACRTWENSLEHHRDTFDGDRRTMEKRVSLAGGGRYYRRAFQFPDTSTRILYHQTFWTSASDEN